MISRAGSRKFSSDAWAVRHEACGLEHMPQLAAYALCPAHHAELAHVGLDSLDIFVGKQLFDLTE